MHLLKIIHGYPQKYNAGSEVYTQSIVDELKNRHKITVFTREENDYALDFRFRKETENNVNFVFVNMARSKDGYNHSLLNEKFGELIKEIKPDVAHIGHLNHLSIGIIDELKKLNIPILYTLHDFWLMCPRGQFLQRNFDGQNLFTLCDKQDNEKCAESCYKMYQSGINSNDDKDYWINWVDVRMKTFKNLVEKIDIFHAPSKYLMNRYVKDFDIPKEKIFYLDYGFPTHYLTPVKPKAKGVFTFGYIGTHIPAKGINLLIEAFSRLKTKAHLKIFGREQGQNTVALKELAEKSENTVEFCGEYINHNLATTVFNNVNCIVVPSIWGENSPLVIHEAQACKIPVITADYGGMKEYVRHKVNGLLFNHRDANSLYEQLKYAIGHSEDMRVFGEKGYLYSKNGEVPNIVAHCNNLEKIYNNLMRNKYEKQVLENNIGY